jgi:hypothetical protein
MKKLFIIILLFAWHLKAVAQITMPNLQSMQYVNSNFGNALNFDGRYAYGLGKAYVTDSLLDFTMEFWIKNTGNDGANDRIYGSYLNNALQIAKNSTHLKLIATDLGGPNSWETVCTLELNAWVHIAIIRNGISLKVYKNATLVQNYTVNGISFLPSFFRLGSNINGEGENGNFSMDEFRIWKIALATSPTNFIQKYMYSSINPNSTVDANPSTKLVLYYRFDQGEIGSYNTNELGLYNSAISN